MNKAFLFLFAVISFTSMVRAEEVYDLFPEAKAWEKSLDYPVYTPEDLWDYINGAADGYLSQEFVDLHIAEYTRGKHTIRVEIYQHMDPAHGYGIYTQERSAGFNFIDVGAQGYLEGSSLNFVNGKYYVKIFGSSDSRFVRKWMKKIAASLSDNIQKDPELPAQLKLFPSEGRLAYKDAFISSNFLGHEFLNGVYTSRYEAKGEKFSLFMLREKNNEAVEQILKQYFEFTNQPVENIQQGRLVIQDPYNGDIHVLWKDDTLYGITGTEKKEIMDEYLNSFSNQ